MKHVVMYSGGVGSWATAKRVAAKYRHEDMVLLFADVKGDNDNPHLGEDEDTYRFIEESAAKLDAELVTLREGRSVWEVFHDDRFLGNSRLANCSKFLKQRPCRAWLDTNCDPENTCVYVGIDWSEIHRLPAIQKAYLPYHAQAPMCDPPYLDKEQMIAACKADGIDPPRMYAAHYPHSNCGGFCVRAGQAQFRLLLRENPERYLFHENEEQKLRDYLGKDVSILKDRTNDKAVPLTLTTFRQRLEQQPSLFDESDFGGCGCFTDDIDKETA